jgi:NADPH:quinone reductase-like Zn-dependent oxidoreductase
LLDPPNEYAGLPENETVAVIGSTGGVGNAVVQFAKRIGARVFAIDLPRASGDVEPAIVADVLLGRVVLKPSHNHR